MVRRLFRSFADYADWGLLPLLTVSEGVTFFSTVRANLFSFARIKTLSMAVFLAHVAPCYRQIVRHTTGRKVYVLSLIHI